MGRLWQENIHSEYPDLGELIRRKNLGGSALLQKDYGKAKGCTVISLAFLFGAEHYPAIEKIAMKHGYNGDKRGTNPFWIKRIMREICRLLHIDFVCRSAYGKGLFFNYRRIQTILDSGSVLLLNMFDDGRHYYHDHTVTVIGYEEYERGKFLLLYDNWNRTCSYLDYHRLSLISSINWIAAR